MIHVLFHVAANIYDSIMDKTKFPQGLRTMMESAGNVSGGEKQVSDAIPQRQRHLSLVTWISLASSPYVVLL